MYCCDSDKDYRISLRAIGLILVLGLILFGLSACKTSAGVGSPVCVDARFGVEPASSLAWLRSDGNVLVAKCNANGFVRLIDKQTGIPLPLSIDLVAGKVIVLAMSENLKVTLDPGQPLPSWTAIVFPDKQVVNGIVSVPALGIVFAPPQP